MNNSILTLTDISHIYTGQENVRAIGHISFSIAPGEIVALVGPSGGGKSTILRIAAGLITPTSGQVHTRYQKIAMVFQDFALFPWLTVEQNIAFGLQMQHVSRAERDRIAKDKLEEVGLHGFGAHYPHELSGGMRQRVAIARALSVEPDLLLMDEPFSALDSITSDHLKKDVLTIWHKRSFAVLAVLHSVADAVELADRIIVFSKRPAVVKEVFRNTLPRPRDMRSQDAYTLIDDITARIDS